MAAGGQAACPGAIQVTHLYLVHVHHVLTVVAAWGQGACPGAIQVTHLQLNCLHHVFTALAAG